MNILIAEDEPAMQKIIRLYLEKEGYQVSVASDGAEAFDMLCHTSYDLLIADWMMPKMNGLELCKEVRAFSLPVKIIMLTAKSEAVNEIAGLTSGADDYVKKPFEPGVLLLRIKKMFQAEEVCVCGGLVLNPKQRTLFLRGEEIRLTQKEFKLLEYLMKNKGITLPRELLLERVWGGDYEGDERTIDTHIRRLRGKLGKEYITTFVGLGYRMEEPHE